MFKVIDLCGRIYDAYGTFVDKDGDVQFILCASDGTCYTTNRTSGYYKVYKDEYIGDI